MFIDHAAIWTIDLEKIKAFYQKYFNLNPIINYINKSKNFESYFFIF